MKKKKEFFLLGLFATEETNKQNQLSKRIFFKTTVLFLTKLMFLENIFEQFNKIPTFTCTLPPVSM